MTLSNENRRDLKRLNRSTGHTWQIHVDNDACITKNISNISPSGLAFKAPSSSHFAQGQRLKLSLSLKKGESFDCEGEVVWIRSSEDIQGSMKHLGLRFSKLPTRIDTAIMKEINDSLLLSRRLAFEKGQVNINDTLKKKNSLQSWMATLCSLFVVISMVSALMAAVYIHQKAHPEETLEYTFNKAMIKKVLNSTK
jgi:hypothetical protein